VLSTTDTSHFSDGFVHRYPAPAVDGRSRRAVRTEHVGRVLQSFKNRRDILGRSPSPHAILRVPETTSSRWGKWPHRGEHGGVLRETIPMQRHNPLRDRREIVRMARRDSSHRQRHRPRARTCGRSRRAICVDRLLRALTRDPAKAWRRVATAAVPILAEATTIAMLSRADATRVQWRSGGAHNGPRSRSISRVRLGAGTSRSGARGERSTPAARRCRASRPCSTTRSRPTRCWGPDAVLSSVVLWRARLQALAIGPSIEVREQVVGLGSEVRDPTARVGPGAPAGTQLVRARPRGAVR
jgi:hypothetical protein